MKRSTKLPGIFKRYRLRQAALNSMEKFWTGYLKQTECTTKETPLLETPIQFNNVTVRKKKEIGQKEIKKEEEMPLDLKNVTVRRRKKGEVVAQSEKVDRTKWIDVADEEILYIKRKQKDNRYQMDLLWKDIDFLEKQRSRRRALDPTALDVRVATMIQELNGNLQRKTQADKDYITN